MVNFAWTQNNWKVLLLTMMMMMVWNARLRYQWKLQSATSGFITVCVCVFVWPECGRRLGAPDGVLLPHAAAKMCVICDMIHHVFTPVVPSISTTLEFGVKLRPKPCGRYKAKSYKVKKVRTKRTDLVVWRLIHVYCASFPFPIVSVRVVALFCFFLLTSVSQRYTCLVFLVLNKLLVSDVLMAARVNVLYLT